MRILHRGQYWNPPEDLWPLCSSIIFKIHFLWFDSPKFDQDSLVAFLKSFLLSPYSPFYLPSMWHIVTCRPGERCEPLAQQLWQDHITSQLLFVFTDWQLSTVFQTSSCHKQDKPPLSSYLSCECTIVSLYWWPLWRRLAVNYLTTSLLRSYPLSSQWSHQ